MLKRILQLLKDIDRNGYEGIGKPRRLSGDRPAIGAAASTMQTGSSTALMATWSRCVQCGSHYRDK